MRRLAVIPARGGSKRIPHKNIRSFFGKPIMAYTIEKALQSGLFDRVLVSTDCGKIAQVAKQYGADVPFMRAGELADDYVGTQDVVADAITRLLETDEEYKQVCCLYATAPLLEVSTIKQSWELLNHSQTDYVVSITEYRFPIQRALYMKSQSILEPVNSENMYRRSQDLDVTYHDAAQVYWGQSEAFLEGRPIWGGNTRGIVLPSANVQDIDTEDDWNIAETKYLALKKSKRNENNLQESS